MACPGSGPMVRHRRHGSENTRIPSTAGGAGGLAQRTMSGKSLLVAWTQDRGSNRRQKTHKMT